MNTIKRILVPTDFSETATHALKYASALAGRIGAGLTVMYADTFLPPIDYAFGVWSETTVPLLEEQARKHLAADIKANVDPNVPSEAFVDVATAADGILEQANRLPADLIIMGTHGRTGLPRMVLGSVTESVMRRASVPVLAVPPACAVTASLRSIVCPVEDNPRAAEGLRLAAKLAPPEARFFVVGAVPDETIDCDDEIFHLNAMTPLELRSRSQSMVITEGRVDEKVSRVALNVHADLIVATEPAHRGPAEMITGTFAERLLRQHPCPVLTLNTRVRVERPLAALSPVGALA